MAVLSHHATDVQNLPSLYDEAFMLVTTTVVVASLGRRLHSVLHVLVLQLCMLGFLLVMFGW